MKTVFNRLAVVVFLVVAPNSCFAVWDILTVSKERAKELGLDVRSKAGPTHVRVELEFKTDGKLKDFYGVTLRVGPGDKPAVSAPLREDRSKPGRVVVGFTADRTQLDKLTLQVSVPGEPGTVGGILYELPVKDFVELKKDR